MKIRIALPLALAAMLAACQESPTVPADVRPLNSTYLGTGTREATDSASSNSTLMGGGTRQGAEDGGDGARSPFLGGTGG
ncbi:MAG TPA: hypothetical protein VGC13_02155 [Longimicrobium sp.]|jgi:hypothetical protein|uniref:hypothetical protein n=1 Tax=Longimicrobium sp. TaxID=2029185 RepID=UPI002EDB201E